MLNHTPFRRIPWLKLEHLLLIKCGLAVTFVAMYFVPHPWQEFVAVSANMVWLFKTRCTSQRLSRRAARWCINCAR